MVGKHVIVAPERGDVVRLNLSPVSGHEQAGVRPALVVSPRSFNEKTGLAFICPITSKVKGYPFEVQVLLEGVNGAVLVDQLRSVDWKARKALHISKMSVVKMVHVQELLETILLD